MITPLLNFSITMHYHGGGQVLLFDVCHFGYLVSLFVWIVEIADIAGSLKSLQSMKKPWSQACNIAI